MTNQNEMSKENRAENLPDSYLKKFCDVHLNVRDCGFAHPFVTNDGKCGFCELQNLREALSSERSKREKVEKELEKEVERWKEKHFNDVMSAKKSGYDDAHKEMDKQLTSLKAENERLQTILKSTSKNIGWGTMKKFLHVRATPFDSEIITALLTRIKVYDSTIKLGKENRNKVFNELKQELSGLQAALGEAVEVLGRGTKRANNFLIGFEEPKTAWNLQVFTMLDALRTDMKEAIQKLIGGK